VFFSAINKYLKFIKEYRIHAFEQSGTSFRFKMSIDFTDGSRLHVKEIIIEGSHRKYSYHWQKENGELLCRWDNAPDWDVPTFPHHRHMGKEVFPSSTVTFEEILKMIVTTMKPS